MRQASLICAVFLTTAVALANVARANPTEGGASSTYDRLAEVDRQIAELQARMDAIQHIKRYAEYVNIYELQGGRDSTEQAASDFLRSTRPSLLEAGAGG